MDNKKIIAVIIVIIVVIVIIYYFVTKSNSEKREEGTETDSNTGTPSSTSSSTQSTSVNTGTGTGTNTGTGTSTPTPTNQITLTKVTPVYYQFKPTQTGYPPTYSNTPVSGITFQPGKVVTITQIHTSASGQGRFYETTEPVNASLLNQVDAYLYIKESDL